MNLHQIFWSNYRYRIKQLFVQQTLTNTLQSPKSILRKTAEYLAHSLADKSARKTTETRCPFEFPRNFARSAANRNFISLEETIAKTKHDSARIKRVQGGPLYPPQ